MVQSNYRDFDVEIRGAPEAGQYIVHVIDAPVGRGAEGRLVLPFSTADLEARVEALQSTILSSADARRADVAPPPDPIQETGRQLWTALFDGAVGRAYEGSRSNTDLERVGLRLKLRLDRDAAALNQLPWEYLYDAQHDIYLAKSTITPIVRFIETDHADDTTNVAPPLRILGLAATPKQMRKLKVENERRELERALQRLIDAGRVELQWVESGTRRELVRMLNEGEWHVFHFIGHGGFDATARNGAGEGVIVLLDEEGMAFRMGASDLAGLLGDEQTLRLAVLNSCDGARGNANDEFSSTAGTIIRRGTPAVVAMQYEITDTAAREFGRSFYEGIASGLPIEAAVAQGRSGIAGELEDSLEWGTPVLYTRAPDNVLFELPKAASATTRTGVRARLDGWWHAVRRHPIPAGLATVAAAAILILAFAFALAKPSHPAIDVSAEEVHPGDMLTITGANFQQREPVQLTIKDILLGVPTADDHGAFSRPVPIPNELIRSGDPSAAMKALAFGRRSQLTAERFITVTPALETPSPSVFPTETDLPNATPSATETPAATGLPEPSVAPTPRPDGCVSGFVWREAILGDHTCVTPDERQQVQIDNSLAAIRVDPLGPFGPETCLVPYVWREIVPGDHVCVTPEERQRVIDDNALGPSRIDLGPGLIIR